MLAYSEIYNFSDGDSHDFVGCVLCDLFLRRVKDDISSVMIFDLLFSFFSFRVGVTNKHLIILNMYTFSTSTSASVAYLS